jgi:hypothetical protein
VFLRENSLQTSKSFRLDRLRGVLELHSDKKLFGRDLRASLAGTTIDLEELRFAPTPTASSSRRSSSASRTSRSTTTT